MPTLETFQICGFKWHKSTDILALVPSIINMSCTVVSESCGYCLEPPIHVLVVFSIQHIESLSFVAQIIISIPSHTFISDEELGEGIPSFIGGIVVLNVGKFLWPHSKLDHVQGSRIELTIDHFSSCQVGWILNF